MKPIISYTDCSTENLEKRLSVVLKAIYMLTKVGGAKTPPGLETTKELVLEICRENSLQSFRWVIK